MKRLAAYYKAFHGYMQNNISKKLKEDKPDLGRRKLSGWKRILYRESVLEKRVYCALTQWRENHPISAVILCTVLAGILLQLLVAIVSEAAVIYFMK